MFVNDSPAQILDDGHHHISNSFKENYDDDDDDQNSETNLRPPSYLNALAEREESLSRNCCLERGNISNRDHNQSVINPKDCATGLDMNCNAKVRPRKCAIFNGVEESKEENELWLTRLPYKIESEQKLSKAKLNQLAIKFKLTKLKSSTIRYEVIYKNLMRDMRKYFHEDFNETTNYIKAKKSHSEE